MLEETIKAVHAAGFKFMLVEDSRTWTAIALGPTADPRYTRAIGFGPTPDAAMKSLIGDIKKQPKTEPVEEDFADLV